MIFGKYPTGFFGIEEEFFILNQDLKPTPKVDIFLKSIPRSLLTNKIIYHEFHKSQIEINSGVCENIDQAKQDITYLRNILKDIAKKNNLNLAAIGTHPTADWKDGILNPNYIRNIERRQQYQAYLTCGMHIHFSMPNAVTACKTINALQYLIPFLIPLTANSPFENNKYRYTQDQRIKIIEQAHTIKNKTYAGIAPKDLTNSLNINNWTKLKKSVNIPMYWDIRPNLKYGTIEFRTFDVQPSAEHSTSFAQLLQILIHEIMRKNLGIPYISRQQLFELRNCAIKDGMKAIFKTNTIKDYWTKLLIPFIKDALSKYTISKKDIDPTLKLIKKNFAQQQIEIFQKTKNLNKITEKFTKSF
ncbi:glutamate-cysteine ligase family protein [Nanoarchaeota archaeon]